MTFPTQFANLTNATGAQLDGNFNALSANTGASLIGFQQSGTGAVARTVQNKLQESISVRDFGAKGDGVTDDTAACNAALAAAYANGWSIYIPNGTYMVSDTGAFGYALYNPGVSINGESKDRTIIAPLSSMPNTSDFMYVNPAAGADLSYLEFKNFMIWPGMSGTKYGRRGINFLFSNTTNISELHFHGVYLNATGNDYSLYINNSIPTNPQGVPANSVFERCEFWEGVYAHGIGDSNVFRNNVFRSTAASGRNGINLYHVDGAGGVSSHTIVEENNISCDGSALYAVRGRNIKFRKNNVESSGAAGPNGAIVDIDGSSGVIPMVSVVDNHIGALTGSTATAAIRINGAIGCLVDQNTLLAGPTTASGVNITASATSTVVGMNEISATFTNPVSDAGTDTRGVRTALTPNATYFGNVGAGYAPLAFSKGRDGLVTLEGLLTVAGLSNGQIIATLPTAARPTVSHRVAAYAIVSASINVQGIEINSNGNIIYEGPSTTSSQVSVSGISFYTQPMVIAAY